MTIPALLLALVVTSGSAAGDYPTILDFHASWCAPCREMRPVVAHLERKGYPIKSVDIDQAPALARRYKVTGVPTLVIVDPAGHELSRTSGVRPAAEVATLYRKAQARFERQAASDSSRDEAPEVDADTDEVADAEPAPEADEHAAPTPKARKLPDPWETVVRIKIHNPYSSPPSDEFGSGTIIYSTPEESIILTCAHIFHVEGARQQYPPSRFPLKIAIDLFDGKLRGTRPAVVKPIETVAGQAVDYDFAGDVGLIRIRPGRRLKASPVVPTNWQPRANMQMTTVGCSEGRPATAWTTHITRPLVRLGRPEGTYEGTECQFGPKQGRSGGGLYTFPDAYVAGVCDFNAAESSGLYASPRTIHRLLDRNRLTVCYAPERAQPPAGGALLARNEVPRRATNDAPKLRAQSPQPGEKPITMPPPEMFQIKLPEAGSLAARGRSSWQPSGNRGARPAARGSTAARKPVGLDDDPDEPRTTGLELSPAAGRDPFATLPGSPEPEPEARPSRTRPRTGTAAQWRAVRAEAVAEAPRDWAE